jgi:serine phosphatase RsbU (regulator of sigma subunit)/ligand-binding sensor domain-containing protein
MNILLEYTKASLICILLFFSSINSYGQDDYLFEHINVSDGLSSSRFNPFEVVYQDKFGFMWFGTVDGLNRYDGYSFEVYKSIPGDSTSLPSSNIQTIIEDADGNLWIGTPGYMSMLNRKTNTFSTYPLGRIINQPQRNVNIFRSYLDSHQNLWIGTQGRGIQKWNKDTREFEIIPILINVEGQDTMVRSQNSAVLALTELKNGNFLISSFTDGIHFYNENSKLFEEYNLAGNEQPSGVAEIFEDRSGNLWITGLNKIIKYNPITFNYEEIESWKSAENIAAETYFWHLDELKDGTLFFNSIPLGLCKYSPTTREFTRVTIEGDLGSRGVGKFPSAKFKDRFGVYWIGLADNGILKFDPERKPFRFYSLIEDRVNQSELSFITSIKANYNQKDELILATNRMGIFKFNSASKEISNFNIDLPELYAENSNLVSLVLDDDDNIWFPYTRTEIASYNTKSKKAEIHKILGGGGALGGDFITRLEYLPKNKLIISTNTGIYIFYTETEKTEKLPSIGNRTYSESLLNLIRNKYNSESAAVDLTKAGESVNLAQDFTIDSPKTMLIACLGEGQYPEGMFDFGTLSDENGVILWSMDQFKNTFNGGGGIKNRLQIDTVNLKAGKYKLSFSTDIGHSYANFNVDSPQDSAWYGIQIHALNENEAEEIGEIIRKENELKDYVDLMFTQAVISSRKYPNTIWFGAGNKGLIKYDISSRNFKQYMTDEFNQPQIFINQLFEDSEGILWIVNTPSGFLRFDPEKEEFHSNTEIPDVPQTAINSLIEDFQGSIWINSSGGITKLIKPNGNNNWSITKYDTKDGVPGGIGGGSIIKSSGEIFFGSFNGLVGFYPSSENETPPIPTITNLTIAEKSIFDKNSNIKLENSIYELNDLSLSFSQNDIAFEFASLHYSRPSKNRVSYQLDGFSTDWTYTDRNFASFTNLEPGDYTFRVRAISGYGVPSNQERSLNISISPPWYRTTLAYIGYGMLFLLTIIAVDRIQRRRLLAKEREKQRIQEAELRAIAAEAQSKAMEAENERKTKELEEARQLQLSMLPKDLPKLPHLDIAVYMKTATEVGGDYYDFHIGLDGKLTVVLGDATGHGMKAGTMVTSTKSLFNVLAPNPNIIETFHEMTRCLKLMHLEKLSMCMTMLKIMGNNIQMSAAGMPPVFIYKKESQSIEEHVMKGMPLGTFNEYPYSIIKSEICKGDTILLMSDGLPELFNDEKEMFGYKRARNLFEELAENSPEEIISGLKNAGSDFINDKDPDDDVTFVVIKVK